MGLGTIRDTLPMIDSSDFAIAFRFHGCICDVQVYRQIDFC